MEPLTLATVAASIGALAVEVSRGAAGEAGKDVWKKIKQVLGSKSADAIVQAQAILSETLQSNPEMLREIIVLLKASQNSAVQQLVGSIDAEKVIVAGTISGDIQM